MAEVMRPAGNLKERFLSFENLYSAWKKAFRAGKNQESCEFSYYLERNLFTLGDELRSGDYMPEDYRYFRIADPKERTISVAPFRDRVVHHALVNVLEPIYERSFIFHSYATRKNKGTHRAIEQARSFLRKDKWYMKFDILKYFGSVDHEILKRILKRKISDGFILRLCGRIISKNEGRGLPIGNLTSQFWANVYLDKLDHFIKEELRVKSYLRYMDDFCLFSSSRDELKRLRPIIEGFLLRELSLRLKDKAFILNNAVHGLPFLGVRIFPSLIRIRRENYKRSMRRLFAREWEYFAGEIDYGRYIASMNSLLSHLRYWNSKALTAKHVNGAVLRNASCAAGETVLRRWSTARP